MDTAHTPTQAACKRARAIACTCIAIALLAPAGAYAAEIVTAAIGPGTEADHELELICSELKDSDLMELHGLESTLVYFATSLRANATVLDRLTRYKRLEQYPDDRELLDDVIVEIRQAIEMTSIYRDDIKGTRELFSSILDNRLNNAMKYLTSITLLMAVPTVISGLYGMNVQSDGMPFANTTAGFAIVLGLTLALCVFAAWVLHKKHML